MTTHIQVIMYHLKEEDDVWERTAESLKKVRFFRGRQYFYTNMVFSKSI